MSAFEQTVEKADPRWQFLVIAAEPYETVAFKVPNLEIDFANGKHFEAWDREKRKYSL